jgi:hypothetical protein
MADCIQACWSEGQSALLGEIAFRQERYKNRMMRKTERNVSRAEKNNDSKKEKEMY